MRSSLFYWHLLNSISGMGSSSLRLLMQSFASSHEVFAADSTELTQLGLRSSLVQQIVGFNPRLESGELFDKACASWEQMQAQQIELLSLHCADYPARLAEITDPPALLYIQGNKAALAEPQIAIVGSRNATHDGIALAQRFGRALAESGLTVTSGMALGVDGAAHQGALTGGGDTCAVLGCGVDEVYPARHRQLAEHIAQQGVLVSEYLPGTQPRAGHFPKRNRIIAGLSCGVLVVEAAPKSGSLITARLAMEYNREVFAIPGSINNSQARGCHALIRDGAVLTETVGDILTELKSVLTPFTTAERAEPAGQNSNKDKALPPLPKELATVVKTMGFDTISVDALSERLAMPVQQLLAHLLELELLNCITATPGGYQRLT